MNFLNGIKVSKVKAFKGWPQSNVLVDMSGTMTGIRIDTSFQTPTGNKIADVMAILGTVVLVVESVRTVFQMPDPELELPLLVACMYVPIKFGLRLTFKQSVTIDVMEERISVRHLLFPRTYAREDVQGFAVEQHEKADQERAQHEFEARRDQVKRRARKRTRYYQDAAQVVLIVSGERIKIADVAKVRDAHRLADRANRAMHQMDRQLERREVARRGQSTVTAPGQLPR